ncbi:MAG TPA: cobalamin-dependent protein, partial [Tepidisphaeraceae bacterium]|nr:cobalamin-dependent protein [Tepidisphaeraceae bacterium]
AGTLAALQDVLRDLLPPAYFDATAPYLAAAAIAVSSAPAAAGPGERGGAGEPIPRAARDYLTAVLSGDRAAARDLVTAVYAAGASLDRVYLDILQPAQRESGRLWQAGRISVAQEHYLTAETQAVMALLSAGRAPPGPRHRASSSTASAADLNVDRDRRGSTSHTWRDSITDNRTGAAPRKVFLAACVAGEFHDVGLRMVGDLLERAGWDVYFCGANTPSDALAAEAALRRATVVGLSATIATHLDPLAQTVRDLRRAPQTAATPILVGGRPFLLAPDLAPRVGATAWAPDAARAVTLAESLVAGN